MSRLPIICCCLILLLSTAVLSAEKKQARLVKIADTVPSELRAAPSLVTADTCIVRHDQGIVYKIDGWVIGNELYKGYQDPAVSCGTGAYPYTVTEINMPMWFARPTPVTVAVDVESVDLTNPACPVPGLILALSAEYTLNVPASGLYDIWIPLDTPLVVNGPFFAGFFLGNIFDPLDSAAVVIDTFPTNCVTYNIWDTTVGFVDLSNNTMWNFPGRLVLYASGIAGGVPQGPPPDIQFVSIQNQDTLLATSELWVWERSGSTAMDYVSFEYRSTGAYIEIGRDFDGTAPIRDGTNSSGTGLGFSTNFDFSSLAEGNYTIRATAFDTSGQSSSDSVTVYLEPTPPTPQIVSPIEGSIFCNQLSLLISNNDENLSYVQAFRQIANDNYTSGVISAGPPTQGAQYNGAWAAALAIKLWVDRGYPQPMLESSMISIATLTDRLATHFKIAENGGTTDEAMVNGLRSYLLLKGNQFDVYYDRLPSYFDLRRAIEDAGHSVVVGLGGLPGMWVTINGFAGWEQPDGSYLVSISNPLAGTQGNVTMRSGFSQWEMLVAGTWHTVDIMVSIVPKDWTVTRASMGADLNGADGWSIDWSPTGLNDGQWMYVFTIAGDATNIKDSYAMILNYDCSQAFAKGDYNGDGSADIIDLDFLIKYIARGGQAPSGGAGRSDANCDGTINIADVVYYMNFLFGSAFPPCY